MKTFRDHIHHDLGGPNSDNTSSTATNSTSTTTTTTVQEYADSFNTTISNVYNLSNVGNTAVAVGEGGGSLSLGDAFNALTPATSSEDVKKYAIGGGVILVALLIVAWFFKH